MAASTYEGIMADLKAKKYAPIYLLQGDEPYFIDQIAAYIEKNVLTDDEKTFNQTIVYGKDTDVANLDNLSKRFPMMAEHQVVIVTEAQDLKKIEDLVFYVQKPQKTTKTLQFHPYSGSSSGAVGEWGWRWSQSFASWLMTEAGQRSCS